MAQRKTSESARWLEDHIQRLCGRHDQIPKAKGHRRGDGKTAYSSHVGRDKNGLYYADVAWRTMEGYDDDPESQTCWCPLSGRMHQHRSRRAESLEGLLTAETQKRSAF
jgi:hypothetical protein